MRLSPLLALCLPLIAQELPAPGDLAVSPSRLVFQGRSRTLELQLANVGRTQATYRLGFLRLAMGEDGRLRQVADLPRSAESLLRFSPRQVSLAPGERQVVRVMLRKPEDLAEGDHRIHLCFQAVPGAPPVEPRPEGGASEGETLQLHLIPIPGVSIPILVRHGASVPAFQVEGAQAAGTQLTFVTAMTGNATLYGTLRVSFQPQGKSTPREVGELKGFVHYADLPRQQISLGLAAPLPTQVGTLHVELLDDDDKIVTSTQAPLSTATNKR